MSKSFRILTIIMTAALFWVLVGCESDPGSTDTGTNTRSRLSSLSGKLSFLKKNSKAKVTLQAGGKKIPATIKDGKFSFDNVPRGPKSLLVNDGSKTIPVAFPAAAGAKYVGLLPDSPLFNKAKSIDLGALKLDENAQRFVTSHNPFDDFDTDGDSLPDFSDDDIDGDGTPNASDPDPYWNDDWAGDADWSDSEWMEEWGWEEEYYDDSWDDDFDGGWEEVCYLDETGAEICDAYDFTEDNWEEYCEDYNVAEDGWEVVECDDASFVPDGDDWCSLPEFADDPSCDWDVTGWDCYIDENGDEVCESPDDCYEDDLGNMCCPDPVSGDVICDGDDLCYTDENGLYCCWDETSGTDICE